MKTMVLSGVAALVLFTMSTAGLADHRHRHQGHHHRQQYHGHQHGHQHGYSRGIRITSNFGGYGVGFSAPNVPYGLYTAPPFQYRGYSPPVTTYHDTSHYDYHPGYVLPHGNHLDVVPGHYHFHRDGHYDTYYPR